VPVVPDAIAGLDDHEIEAQGQPRHGRSIRQDAPIEQPVSSGPDANTFSTIDGLLGEAEVPTGPPADLDHYQRRGRTRIDRHEVELVTADMDVPGQDGPAGVRESRSDERLGGITGLLRRRSRLVAGSVRHPGIVAADPYPRRIGDRRGDLQPSAPELRRAP
jgi:hypothetical protein